MSRDSTASTGIATPGVGKKTTVHLQLRRSLADDKEFWTHNDQTAHFKPGKPKGGRGKRGVSSSARNV